MHCLLIRDRPVVDYDKAKPTLLERLQQAFANPASINRFGGLCLGESRDLVDTVTLLPENYHGEPGFLTNNKKSIYMT